MKGTNKHTDGYLICFDTHRFLSLSENKCMWTHNIDSLLIAKDICDSKNLSVKFVCVYVCSFHLEMSSFFQNEFPLSFLIFVLIFIQLTQCMLLFPGECKPELNSLLQIVRYIEASHVLQGLIHQFLVLWLGSGGSHHYISHL